MTQDLKANQLPAHRRLLDAAAAVVRDALDAVTVHPCDEHNDAVRASRLSEPMRLLYAAIASPTSCAEHDDARYEALEREHFGDPDKQTGIYAPRGTGAPSLEAAPEEQVIAWENPSTGALLREESRDMCDNRRRAWFPLVRGPRPARFLPATADAPTLTGIAARAVSADGRGSINGVQSRAANTGDRLTDVKANSIIERDGYLLTGVVLTGTDGRKCIVDLSAVRWLHQQEFRKLMHPDASALAAVAWEYRNQHGNPFLTYKDPAKWHPHDRAGFGDFRALAYAEAGSQCATSGDQD